MMALGNCHMALISLSSCSVINYFKVYLLKIMHVNYFTVSLGLAEFSASWCLRWLKSKYQPGVFGLIWRFDWGRIDPFPHSRIGCWRHLVPCGLLAGGHPQFLAVWASLKQASWESYRKRLSLKYMSQSFVT